MMKPASSPPGASSSNASLTSRPRPQPLSLHPPDCRLRPPTAGRPGATTKDRHLGKPTTTSKALPAATVSSALYSRA